MYIKLKLCQNISISIVNIFQTTPNVPKIIENFVYNKLAGSTCNVYYSMTEKDFWNIIVGHIVSKSFLWNYLFLTENLQMLTAETHKCSQKKHVLWKMSKYVFIFTVPLPDSIIISQDHITTIVKQSSLTSNTMKYDVRECLFEAASEAQWGHMLSNKKEMTRV